MTVGASTAADRFAPHILDVLGHPAGELFLERAVEQAIGADVTAPADGDAGALAAAEGIAAILRY